MELGGGGGGLWRVFSSILSVEAMGMLVAGSVRFPIFRCFSNSRSLGSDEGVDGVSGVWLFVTLGLRVEGGCIGVLWDVEFL